MEKNSRIIRIMLAGGIILMLFSIITAINVTGYRNTYGQEKLESELSYFKDFSLNTLDGGTVGTGDLAQYDLTVLNGWAPWCDPCKAEMPDLETLSQEMKDRGVLVAGVAADYDPEKKDETYLDSIREMVEETGVTYPVLLPDGGFLEQVVPTMNGAFPGTWFIRDDGTVAGFVSGRKSIAELRELVNTYLNEGEEKKDAAASDGGDGYER